MESISDYIGFIISLIAMLFLLLRRGRPEEEAEGQEGEPKSQEDALKDFLRTMNIEVEEEKPKPRFKPRPKPPVAQPKPEVKKQSQQDRWRDQNRIEERRLKTQIEERRLQTQIEERQFQTNVEQRRLESKLEQRYTDPFGKMPTGTHAGAYEVIQNRGNDSRAARLLEKLPSKQEMVILQEIMGPPKGLR